MLRALRPAITQVNKQSHVSQRIFAAMALPHPVILCGKTETMGAGVIEDLKPEFEGTILYTVATITSKSS